MALPREAERRADGGEAERLGARGGAAARRDAAELRHGEGERERGQHRAEEAPALGRAPRRGQQEAGGRAEQPARPGEERTEREARDAARRVPRRAEASARAAERGPERGTQRRGVERVGAHAGARRRASAVCATWSDAQNR